MECIEETAQLWSEADKVSSTLALPLPGRATLWFHFQVPDFPGEV